MRGPRIQVAGRTDPAFENCISICGLSHKGHRALGPVKLEGWMRSGNGTLMMMKRSIMWMQAMYGIHRAPGAGICAAASCQRREEIMNKKQTFPVYNAFANASACSHHTSKSKATSNQPFKEYCTAPSSSPSSPPQPHSHPHHHPAAAAPASSPSSPPPAPPPYQPPYRKSHARPPSPYYYTPHTSPPSASRHSRPAPASRASGLGFSAGQCRRVWCGGRISGRRG